MVEVTNENSTQNLMGDIIPYKSDSRLSIENYSGPTFAFIPHSIPRIQIINQVTTCIFENSSRWLHDIYVKWLRSQYLIIKVPEYKSRRG